MKDVVRLVSAEWMKLRSVRLVPLVLAVTVGLAAALVCAKLAFSDADDLRGEEALREVLSIGGATGAVMSLVLGVLAAASDGRAGLLDRSALAVPRRWPVIVAKLPVIALAGAGVGLAAAVVTFAVALPWMDAEGVGFALTGSVAREVALGSVAAGGLVAAAGAGLGALFQREVVALLVGIAWLVVLDVAVGALEDELARYLPGGTVAALLRQPQDDLLPMGFGALALLGHVALLAVLASYLLTRRDLT